MIFKQYLCFFVPVALCLIYLLCTDRYLITEANEKSLETIVIAGEKATNATKATKATNQTMVEYVETKLVNATDRTKSIVAARLELMEASNGIIEDMKKVNISIVVSHCEESLAWIPGFIGKDYSIRDITIYSKCNNKIHGRKQLENFSPTVQVIRLPNVGRCDHTYAYWINQHFKSINKEVDGNDIVMFLKDNNRDYDMYHPIDLIFSHVSKSGFACVTGPTCNCNIKCRHGLHVPMIQHKREYLFQNFSLDQYQRLERDEVHAFKSEQYSTIGEWKEDMGFVIPESETVPVCYKGLFVAQKKQILNQPEESWKNMVISLSRADNIIEGHFAERLWASILSDNDYESTNAIDKALLPYIVEMVENYYVGPKGKEIECPMRGMLYVHKNSTITG